MEKCPKCGRRYFSKTQFLIADYDGQNLLVCPECIYVLEKRKMLEQGREHQRLREIKKKEEIREHEEAIKKKYGELIVSVVYEINNFKPLLPNYENELPYHIDLARWLEPKFPMLKVEFQLGSARPDIVIEDIAIEIKGPTYEEGLQSIADKCLRYHHHFNKMIVVLFDIRTKTKRFYTEWEDGMEKNFPDVVIIKK